MKPMRILLTGSEGYLGVVMADELLGAGHDVVGLDSGFHRAAWLYRGVLRQPELRLADVRDVQAVVLGGSRVNGTATPDSDWDLGLDYRGPLDLDPLRELVASRSICSWATLPGSPRTPSPPR